MGDKEEILDYYNAGGEEERLNYGIGKIEFERTKEIISRYLTKKKLVIYDIGGGVGIYSSWLAEMGHEIHLFDLAPEAISLAKEKYSEKSIHKFEVGDARKINRDDESADMVLLMGPLYHLTELEERIKAIQEAKRVLKMNGIMIVTAISRFSSTLYGLSVFGERNNLIEEDEFIEMINREITDGQHIRPKRYPGFIARSFFHLPKELKKEVELAGLKCEKILSVEGPIWIVPTFEEKWSEEHSRKRLVEISRKVEEQESLIGMSPHILAIAKK